MKSSREVKNTIWLLSEKLISIFGLLFVTSFVAKFIGPEDFGKLNFSIYCFTIIQTFAVWGSDTIGIKKICKNESLGVSFLKGFMAFKYFIFIVFSLPLLCYFYYFSDRLTFVYCLAVAISTLFSIADYFYIYNEARLNSLYNVISNVIGLFFSILCRYFVAYYKMDPEYLSVSIVVSGVIPFIIRMLIFYSGVPSQLLSKYKVKTNIVHHVNFGIRSGFGLLISSVSIMIYVNSSRLILSYTDSLRVLGIYSVAITLGTMWGFVNNALVVSFTPQLYSSDDSDKKDLLKRIYFYLLLVMLGYLSFFGIVGHYIIEELYGGDYISAYKVSFILILSTTLSALGMVTSRYIISFNGYSYLAKKSLYIAAFGLITGFLFIKLWGMYGAAYNTLLIELLSLTFFNYFFKCGVIFRFHKYMLLGFFIRARGS